MTKVNMTTNCSPYCSFAWTPAEEEGENKIVDKLRGKGGELLSMCTPCRWELLLTHRQIVTTSFYLIRDTKSAI